MILEVIFIKTIVYIVRHSQPFRDLLGEYHAEEQEQIRNGKNPLSVEGEKRAEQLSECKELQDIDVIYSSHYVRTMDTAKYIAEKNQIQLNVDQRFGERKFGVASMNELPSTFFEDQFKNWNYKLPKGESLNEVASRMVEGFMELINQNKGKKVVLVSHGTALSAMLSKWCKIRWNEKTKLVEIYFNNKMIFDGNWKAPELFKMELEEDNLINIENIDWQ